jgi:hypothetical protein
MHGLRAVHGLNKMDAYTLLIHASNVSAIGYGNYDFLRSSTAFKVEACPRQERRHQFATFSTLYSRSALTPC